MNPIHIRIKNRLIYIFRFVSWRLLKLVTNSVKVKTKFGSFHVLLSDDVIGYMIYLRRHYDLVELQRLFKFLKENDLIPKKKELGFLDLGANNGVIGIQALKMEEVQKVLAIEPEPKNYELLEKNIAENSLEGKAIPMRFAVGSGPGELEFELDEQNSGDSRVRVDSGIPDKFNESKRRTISVPSNTLDHIVKEAKTSIDIAWMDIQGFEGMALKYGSTVFGAGVPSIIEVWPYGLKRANMDLIEFSELIQKYWTHFYLLKRNKFESHSTEKFKEHLLNLEKDDSFEDILFVKK